MNEYLSIVKEIRSRVSKLTLEQQQEVLKIYEDAIESLSSKAAKAKDKTLTKRWLTDYTEEIKKAQADLVSKVNEQIQNAIKISADLGTQPEQTIMKKIFETAGIDPGEHFTSAFSNVAQNVIDDIVSGNLYKDRRGLSKRIWRHAYEFEKDIQYIINQAILEKKSAIEFAKDVEKYVKPAAKRPTTWRKIYPNLRNKQVDYNAQRLARTVINHSYQISTIKSTNINPFVEVIEWRSALIHGRTCEICRERHGKHYPKDSVPMDHPNGLCTMLPVPVKSLDKIAEELRSWVDGMQNEKLDKWYEEYGEYFAFKKL